MPIRHRLVPALKAKSPEWRQRPPASAAPYVVMVPGNHDLDWRQAAHEQKVEAYARMAENLYGAGEVLSSNYHGERRPVSADFGDEVNVFVYLLDSTSLGGIVDPTIMQVYNELAAAQRKLLENDADEATLRKTLETVERLTRKDPGYVPSDALEQLQAAADRIPAGRLKIAAVHHNPTSVPSDNVDSFDVIINAGRVKQALAMSGFDVVLYGHRHIFHCSSERLQVPRGRQGPLEAELGGGMLFVAGDSLGEKQSAPFVELSLTDLPAHQTKVPVCLLSVYRWRHESGFYEPDPEPVVQSTLSTPVYRALDRVARNIGRPKFFPRDSESLRDDLKLVLPPIEELRAKMVDWGPATVEWIATFHSQLKRYYGIYATDLQERFAPRSIRFMSYLKQQYVERLDRLLRQERRELCFSRPVFETIERTGWRPNRQLWGDCTVRQADRQEESSFEIARILIRPCQVVSAEDFEVLENLEFDHRLFAIPLFVLNPEVLDAEHQVDIAVAVDRDGHPMRSFEYDKHERRVVESLNAERQAELYRLFGDLLANPGVTTAQQVLAQAKVAGALPLRLIDA